MKKPFDLMIETGEKMLQKEFSQVSREKMYRDLFGENENGDCCEIEIKVSDYDFNKEFTKRSKIKKHLNYKKASKTGKGFVPTRFYYFIREKYVPNVIRRTKRKVWHQHYGIISFNYYQNKVEIVRKSSNLKEVFKNAN